MIYFDVTTFDFVINDRAAKFVDILAAFAGTLGLLTGFSLISAVEIFYFGLQIIFEYLNKRFHKVKTQVITIEEFK